MLDCFHKISFSPYIIFLSVFFISEHSNAAQRQAVADYVPGQVLVKYHNDVKGKSKPGIRKAKNVLLKATMPSLHVELWQLMSNQSVENAVAELNSNPRILIAEPNYRRYSYVQNQPDDALLGNQLFSFEQVMLPEAWAEIRGDASVIVAVIDDAFDIDHEDLADNIIYPFNALNNGSDPRPADCVDPWTKESLIEDHGTKVAGVLGAVTNNAKGIAGVSWNTRIMPIKIGCTYSVAAELLAFEQAIKRGVDIINVSYGGPMYSELERIAINQLKDSNILLVVAAGNRETDNDRVLDYPSSLPLPNILSVAASDASRGLASWSQYGQTSIDLAAPGVGISSLLIGNKYASNLNGSSFSTPIVAGVAALVKSSFIAAGKTASFYDLKGAILASVRRLKTAPGRLATDGQVNALGAILTSKSPQPVFVIKGIVIDDLELGNNNGLLDANERFTLRLEIENTWASIDIPTVVRLYSDALVSPLNGIIPPMAQGQVVDLVFSAVELTQVTSYQKVLFELKIDPEKQNIMRYFAVVLGQLTRDQMVINLLNKRLDDQDEFHYYHVTLPDDATNLEIEIEAKDSRVASTAFELLVKHGSAPMFDYTSFENGNVEVESGVIVGADADRKKIVTIPSPESGTYFITLVAAPDFSQPNLQYTIRANYQTKALSGVLHPLLLFFLVSIVLCMRRSTLNNSIKF